MSLCQYALFLVLSLEFDLVFSGAVSKAKYLARDPGKFVRVQMINSAQSIIVSSFASVSSDGCIWFME
jgi:hypothetical protein